MIAGIAALTRFVLGIAVAGPVLPTVTDPASLGSEIGAPAVDVQFQHSFVTENDAGLGLGNRVIRNALSLLDGEGSGHTSGVCTVTDVAGELLCNIVFALEDGTLATQVLNTLPPLKTVPMPVGTGPDQGATGSGEPAEFPEQSSPITSQFASVG